MSTITAADELPISRVPTDSYWSENWCFDGYDPVSGYALWIHMGRWSLDTSLWREQIYIFTPDNGFLIQRCYGFSDEGSGPWGSLLRFTYDEGTASWRLRFKGPVRRTTGEEVDAGLPGEGVLTALDLDLLFTSGDTIWDWGSAAQDEIWCSTHFEQPGRLRGTIRYDGRSVDFDGPSFRDRSRGRRDMSNFHRHCWIHGRFPSGTAFMLMSMLSREDGTIKTGFSRGAVWRNGRHVEAELLDMPYLALPDGEPRNYIFRMKTADETLLIEGEAIRTLPISNTAKVENFFVGVRPDVAHMVAFEQPTRFRLNEEVGYGLTERAAPFEKSGPL